MTLQNAVKALAEVMPGKLVEEMGVVSAMDTLVRVTPEQVNWDPEMRKLEGKALVGELCVEPVCSGHNVITALPGCLVVLCNARLLDEDEEAVRVLYPRYAEVAIKEPQTLDVGGYFSYPVVVVSCPLSLKYVGVKRRGITSLRDEGNRRFREGQYILAKLYYEACMNEEGSEAVLAASNKALACSKLALYEEVVMTCDWVLAREETHTKCLFRKGVALCALQQFGQAIPCLEAALEHDGKGSRKTIKEALEDCIKRLKQSEDGVYDDLEQYYTAGLKASLAPTCNDYVSPAVGIGQGNTGLFVTQPVKVGELLLVCSPLLPQCSTMDDFFVKALRLCGTSRRLRTQLLTLHPDSASELSAFVPNAGSVEEPGGPSAALDVQMIVQVLNTRCMTFTAETSHDASVYGLIRDLPTIWGLATLVNHSCLPNVSLLKVGQSVFVRASRDLAEGSQLLRSHVDGLECLPVRTRQLQNIRLVCNCIRCQAERVRSEPLSGAWSSGSCEAFEQQLREITRALSDKEKCWLRTGMSRKYIEAAEHGFANIPDVIRAVHDTVPGYSLVTASALACLSAAAGGCSKDMVAEEFKALFGPVTSGTLTALHNILCVEGSPLDSLFG